MSPLTLPDDVIPDILCRLPVKDLLRYRSVSKPWRSLIDGPNFTKLHLTHSQNQKRRGAIVAAQVHHLYMINLHCPGSATKLPNPIADCDKITGVVGSCNGLVALQNYSADINSDTAIWNPATRWYQRVPIPGSVIRGNGRVSCPTSNTLIGFGHDPVSGDYKLVMLLAFVNPDTDDSEEYVFMVYSAKAKMWKRLEGQSFAGLPSNGHTVVRSAIHWIVVPFDSNESISISIVAFDVGPERFREVPHPDFGSESCREHMDNLFLVELKGCLGMVYRINTSGEFVVWMMNEYGVGESWTKLFSVGPTELGGPFTYVEPLAFVRDRVLLEKDSKEFVLYDPRNKSAEIVKISGVDKYRDVCTFDESLAKVDRDIGASVKEKPKQSGKKRDGFLSKGFKLKL